MGAIFFIVFLAAIAALGVTLLLVGIIGTVICRKRRRENQNTYVRSPVIFTVIIVIGCLTLLPPIGFASFIVIVNTLPPDGFVETELVIEENGYQDTKFTVYGMVFEATEYYLANDETVLTPYFTYKTKGFLNGSQCGNYYKFEANGGFPLVCDEFGTIFCTYNKKPDLEQYYSDPQNLTAYYDNGEETRKELSETDYNALQGFLKNDLNSLNSQSMVADDSEQFVIDITGKDGIICTESHWFVIISDKVYYEKSSFGGENDRVEYNLIELPKGLSDTLISIHNR